MPRPELASHYFKIYELKITKKVSQEYKTNHHSNLVASSGIEPESGASETLILSIVRRGPKIIIFPNAINYFRISLLQWPAILRQKIF